MVGVYSPRPAGAGDKAWSLDRGGGRELGEGREKGATLRPGISSGCSERFLGQAPRKSQFHLGLLDWYERVLVMEDETYFI